MPTRPRWSPSMTDTAREYFDRAMTYLIQDYTDDAKDYQDPTDLFAIYANKAAQLGRDLAEDIQAESDAHTVAGWASPIAPWHPSQPVCP